jgi:hypothetical protein
MSKTITRNKTYISLLENSLHELFSPSSKKALLDYDQLKLIDTKQLKVIDFDQLKLLNMEEFALLDLAVLSVFFQYIGAFFLTLSFGFMVAFGAFTVHSAINTTVLAEEYTPSALVQAPIAHTESIELASAVVEGNAPSRTSFAALIDEKPIVKAEAEEAVLGASVVDEPPVILAAQNSCSFSVVEGEKTVRVASGSEYTPSKVFKLCVDSNKESSAFVWNLGSKASGNDSNCVTSYELSNASSVSVSVLNNDQNVVAICGVSLVKNAVMVAK